MNAFQSPFRTQRQNSQQWSYFINTRWFSVANAKSGYRIICCITVHSQIIIYYKAREYLQSTGIYSIVHVVFLCWGKSRQAKAMQFIHIHRCGRRKHMVAASKHRHIDYSERERKKKEFCGEIKLWICSLFNYGRTLRVQSKINSLRRCTRFFRKVFQGEQHYCHGYLDFKVFRKTHRHNLTIYQIYKMLATPKPCKYEENAMNV